MMIQGRPSSLSGIISAQASSLSGLGDCDPDDLVCQGIDTNIPSTLDPSFPTGSVGGGSTPVTITAPSSNLIGQCAVLNPDGSCATYYAAPLSSTSGGTIGSGVSTSAAGSLASILSSFFGSAASVANTALKSTTQTCQVINGQTVCTTESTGGGSPTTTASIGGLSSSTLLILGIGVIALLAFGGKK
jgi:hypothetical protein